MQVKAALSYYLTMVRKAVVKKPTNHVLERLWRKGSSPVLLLGK